jgi:hypothetical protein
LMAARSHNKPRMARPNRQDRRGADHAAIACISAEHLLYEFCNQSNVW